MNFLLIFLPLSLVSHYWLSWGSGWEFALSCLAIVPLADFIRRSTENISEKLGGAIGGLLNITFGNVAELVLALFLLSRGNIEVVKAQITGSIIGNGLLGLGMAILVGSIGRKKQIFNRERAGLLGSLLTLSLIALAIPALFDYTERGIHAATNASLLDEKMSLGVAAILILVYFANLVYTLYTHEDIFAIPHQTEEPKASNPTKIGLSVVTLVLATCFVTWEAEILTKAIEGAAASFGVSEFFLGITVVAVAGNAAEYISALYFARKGQMDLVLTITVGATIQICLLIAPLLVIFSSFTAHPMNLVFENPLELAAIAGTALAINSISRDGETNWFEGLLLVAVWAILATAFRFVTP